ncbi:Hint domain-containing protein [Polyangium fumosum]|nr:Hint domain-containing protein [Polyangium fumosum]
MKKITTAALVVGWLFQAQVAGAQDINVRCNNDLLDPAQARARLEWARYCGLTKNVGSPMPANPAKREDLGYLSVNGQSLIEFYEDFSSTNFWSLRTYTSVGVEYQINDTYVSKQWQNGLPSTSLDVYGFQKWTRPATKAIARPMYPTFGTNASPEFGSPLFPHEHLSTTDCNLYTTRNGGSVRTDFYVNGYCTSSCYTPEQKVRMPKGDVAIREAIDSLMPEVMTVAAGSTLDDFKLVPNKVATYTTELYDTEHVIFEIEMASGGLLRVTDEHPIIQSDGRIVQAKTLKVGDELVTAQGKLDPIAKVTRTTHFGKVYNLKPATSERITHVLVAENYLVGSSAFQNEDVDYINRVIMFRSLPAEVIPQ